MTSGLTEEKRIFRKTALEKRRALSNTERTNHSSMIQKLLFDFSVFREAKRIFAFASMPDEVQTNEILAGMLEAGKEVAIPLITGPRKMEAAAFSDMADLVPEKYGILTVKPEKRRILDPSELDFVLVPGVAFSKNGIRLGMGGGYYDDFLKRASSAYRLAVVYGCQVFDTVPQEPWDEQVDAILTEKGIDVCPKRQK
ncbi:MAG: 5-formyltetrahydrofolate cyclo-ligase [Schwartzia succinivorans]|jgi:5-formyltetrahydrofolate cyclo-ligase|uniref:5-formyltetrahydrofolate cyclo-ligase n=1 Tax=Schwartzia succinivorans TaxID=55507 RepID=UPI002352EA3B|nr:5-formyltetrahydrofolate cyclo-ligase [Schwartzia succinivorans]MBE6098376.1 5-formyltetrahydrofolate cyclo-ligase [Schwartzia succinivorans]